MRHTKKAGYVTILILIDGFLQFVKAIDFSGSKKGHNPYFNRWFSAIIIRKLLKPAFHRHNPYFNRWFSAIYSKGNKKMNIKKSQSLF